MVSRNDNSNNMKNKLSIISFFFATLCCHAQQLPINVTYDIQKDLGKLKSENINLKKEVVKFNSGRHRNC